MSVTVDLLDRWKRETDVPNDNQAAIKLGIGRAAISKWRSDNTEGEAHVIEQMARDLGERPEGHILMALARQQKNDRSRKTLVEYAKKFAPFAAAMVMCLANYTIAKGATVHNATNVKFDITQTEYTFTSMETDDHRAKPAAANDL